MLFYITITYALVGRLVPTILLCILLVNVLLSVDTNIVSKCTECSTKHLLSLRFIHLCMFCHVTKKKKIHYYYCNALSPFEI